MALIFKEGILERTLSIIKPDAVKKQVIGKILDRFESNGLRIAALKKLQLSKEQAQKFYEIHKDRTSFILCCSNCS